MTSLRTCALLLGVVLSACGDGDAAAEDSEIRGLVNAMMEEADHGVRHRCGCLVDQGVLYDSVEPCVMALGWDPAEADCAVMALTDDGTPELLDAVQCLTDHLKTVGECSAGLSCEEVVDGACDAAYAASPCRDAMLDLLAFLVDHCPNFDLHSRQ